jgi:H+/Cl- antiporter ClcA
MFHTDHPNLMVLLGMIGFLTGVTRTPFTSFILVLEMTNRHLAIFPMMLAALSAQWIAQFVDNKSFYEHVKDSYLTQSRF